MKSLILDLKAFIADERMTRSIFSARIPTVPTSNAIQDTVFSLAALASKTPNMVAGNSSTVIRPQGGPVQVTLTVGAQVSVHDVNTFMVVSHNVDSIVITNPSTLIPVDVVLIQI